MGTLLIGVQATMSAASMNTSTAGSRIVDSMKSAEAAIRSDLLESGDGLASRLPPQEPCYRGKTGLKTRASDPSVVGQGNCGEWPAISRLIGSASLPTFALGKHNAFRRLLSRVYV